MRHFSRWLTGLFALALVLIGAVFALRNPGAVSLDLGVMQVTQPLSLLLLGVYAFGILLGMLVLLPGLIRRSLRARRAEKRLHKLEAELREARIAPLRDHD
jgi:uncharacterized integral membrane protein